MTFSNFPSFFPSFGRAASPTMVPAEDALPGRPSPVLSLDAHHKLLGTPLLKEPEENQEVIYLGMGCFWGTERIYWQTDGVVATAAGYLGGYTPNPTYRETTTERTGHAEVVRVVYDTRTVSTAQILATFFENHDPTTPNRQGNDVGTTYRSGIWFTTDEQRTQAIAARTAFARALGEAGFGAPSTEIRPYDEAAAQESGDEPGSGEVGRPGIGGPFYLAEDEHQQYLHTNPSGYCNHGPNGLTCQVGVTDMPKEDASPQE